MITQAPSLSVAGSTHPDGLVEQIRELQPDVVLLEWLDASTEALEPLLKSGPVFVLLVDDPDAPTIAAGLRLGLRAALPRQASAGEITAAIEAAAEGLIVLHPEILPSLQVEEPARKTLEEISVALTPRETEVLRMLAEGLANKNIAFRLGISEHTVKYHITSIYTKLNASSRAEAVAIGIRQGIILL